MGEEIEDMMNFSYMIFAYSCLRIIEGYMVEFDALEMIRLHAKIDKLNI